MVLYTFTIAITVVILNLRALTSSKTYSKAGKRTLGKVTSTERIRKTGLLQYARQ